MSSRQTFYAKVRRRSFHTTSVKRRNDRPEIRLPLHPRKRTWTIPCPKMRGVANGVPTEATVCFSRLEPTLHGSPALCLAAGVVVLPLHTRHRHRQHVMTCLQRYP